jgi:hypothetical protein
LRRLTTTTMPRAPQWPPMPRLLPTGPVGRGRANRRPHGHQRARNRIGVGSLFAVQKFKYFVGMFDVPKSSG